MDGEEGNDENRRHRDAGQGYKRAEEDGEAAEEFAPDGDVSHQAGSRDTEGVEGGGKDVWSALELGDAVHEEAVADDQTYGKRSPASQRGAPVTA